MLSFENLEGVTLITCVAFKGPKLYQIQCRVIFCGLLANTNTLALMTRRDLQNPLKITLHGIFHCLAPNRATKFPKMPFWTLPFTGHQWVPTSIIRTGRTPMTAALSKTERSILHVCCPAYTFLGYHWCPGYGASVWHLTLLEVPIWEFTTTKTHKPFLPFPPLTLVESLNIALISITRNVDLENILHLKKVLGKMPWKINFKLIN